MLETDYTPLDSLKVVSDTVIATTRNIRETTPLLSEATEAGLEAIDHAMTTALQHHVAGIQWLPGTGSRMLTLAALMELGTLSDGSEIDGPDEPSVRAVESHPSLFETAIQRLRSADTEPAMASTADVTSLSMRSTLDGLMLLAWHRARGDVSPEALGAWVDTLALSVAHRVMGGEAA